MAASIIWGVSFGGIGGLSIQLIFGSNTHPTPVRLREVRQVRATDCLNRVTNRPIKCNYISMTGLPCIGYDPKMADAEHEHLIWKDRTSSLEIRFGEELDDGRPAFDELLAVGSRVQVQQMLPDGWGVSITAAGKEFYLAFTVEADGHLWVRVSDMDEESAWWNGDNRPKPLPGESD